MKKLISTPFTRRLNWDDRGNVAIVAALAIAPLTLASIGAVDLTHSLSARVELQDALDAAALAAGRSTTQDETVLQAIGERILRQNLANAGDVVLSSSSFKLNAKGAVVASASATFQPMMTALAGGGPAEVQASTEVMRAGAILEIALVLDNTGSMDESLGPKQDSKISYLKTAATSFVDTMDAASRQNTTPNSVRISLVPFSNMIKVGTEFRNSTWVDQNAASPINDEIFTTKQGVTQHANRFDLLTKLNTSWEGCVETRKAPYDVQDTAPSTGQPATLFTPTFAPDEEDGQLDKHGRKLDNDYITDPLKDSSGAPLDWWGRQGSISKYSTKPTSKLGTSYGPNRGCTIQKLQRLTTDFTSLKTAIKAMVADGNTNIPLGLVWGWHTLSPNAPFADGVTYLKPKYRKIVVLMTDGENWMSEDPSTSNNSFYSAVGYVWQGRLLKDDGNPLTRTSAGSSDATTAERTAALDSRTKLLCANMKAADVGIEIYTIGVGVSAASKTLLQGCATGADHYFDVSAGTGMNAAFQSVANQISQLHLSK
jgi:Flp pilus assembly protein TadG